LHAAHARNDQLTKQVASLQAKQQLSPSSTTDSATANPVKKPEKPPMHGQHWSQEDREELIESIRLGKLKPAIARALGRSENAVQFQWAKEQAIWRSLGQEEFGAWFVVQSATYSALSDLSRDLCL